VNKKRLNIFLILFIVILSIQFVPIISSKTIGMEKIEKKNFIYYSVDSSSVEVLNNKLEAERKRLLDVFNEKSTSKVVVFIYRSNKQFHIKKIGGIIGLFIPEWVIGTNDKKAIFITDPKNPGNAHTSETIIDACIHEYVHVLTDNINSNISLWLKEGLAVYFANQKPQKDFYLDIKYSDFTTKNSIQFGNNGGYAMAYKYIDFLIKTYGYDKLHSLLKSSENYESVYGISKNEMYIKWKETYT
jgi:hypothetical protein